MKEAIRELLAVEEQAKEILAEGDEKAREVRRRAQVEADALVERARSGALAESEATVEKVAGDARDKKTRRLEEARREVEEKTRVDAELRAALVAWVSDVISGTEDA